MASESRVNFRRLNDEIYCKHALTFGDVTNRAISEYMDDPCGEQAVAHTLAGGSTNYHTPKSNALAVEDGTLTLGRVLAGSSFLLPLESKHSAFAWNGTVLTG